MRLRQPNGDCSYGYIEIDKNSKNTIMTLTQDLQVTPTQTVKFEITGHILPDGTYQGNVLYKVDSEIETKYWVGNNPQIESEGESIRALINE